MIQILLLTFLLAPVRAEMVHLKDGGEVRGVVVKSDADAVVVQVEKDSVDPDDWVRVSRSTSTGILLLKNGWSLRGIVAAPVQDFVVLTIPKERIESVGDGLAQAQTSPPALVPRPAPPPAYPFGRDLNWTNPYSAPTERENDFSVNAGLLAPFSRLSLQGTDTVAGNGFAFGAQYFRQGSSRLAFGAGVERLIAGQSQSTALIDDASTHSQFDSTMILALARLTANADRYRFNLIGGLGLASTTLQVSAAPQAHYVWLDTLTTETRTLVDSTKTCAVLTLQPTIDVYLRESVWLGAGLAYYALSSATYDATTAGQNLGLAGVHGAIGSVVIEGHFNMRF